MDVPIEQAHAGDWQAEKWGAHHWRDPRGARPTEHGNPGPYDERFRTCSYCGSIHPADFLAALGAGGAHIDRADMKYGWPHKFYADFPNPIAGKEGVELGGTSYTDESGARRYDPYLTKAPERINAKFYAAHLLDCPDELFDGIAAYLDDYGGIRFTRRDGDLFWRTTGPSYRPGVVTPPLGRTDDTAGGR